MTREKGIDDLGDLFKYLSNRFSKENYLSDFLYALLSSQEDFRKLFYDLLNEKGKGKVLSYENFIDVSREISFESIGRPDFLITQKDNNGILIEVKKYDTNYHFQQYNKIENCIKCLISINKCEINNENKDWLLIRWEELIKKMQFSENEIIRASALLFEKGCDMESIKKVVNLEIRNLLYLNRMIKKALSILELDINTRSKSFTEEGAGYYFDYPINEKYIYPWIGINYNEQNPFGLMFWLNKYQKQHMVVLQNFRENNIFTEKYFTNYHNNELVVMTLTKEEEWQHFFNLDSEDGQIEFIRNFIEDNLKKTRKILEVK